ncbi:MAG: SpvB/TcaC N-terminal domain-containing protein, partial [Nanoarchaeota archaeon]
MVLIPSRNILSATISFILIIVILTNVSAVDPLPYVYDTIVPKQQSLEARADLIANLFSGAVTYNYQINVPPGTNGLKPNVNLFYNSHSATQRPGILGGGWSFSESYIQRDANYTFDNKFDDDFVLVLEGISYELVHNKTNNRFHTRIESFMHIRNISGGNNDNDEYWIIRAKDGTSYRFGFFNFSEILSNQYNYTWRWYLDKINDTYSNAIFYNYTENPFSGDSGTAYLDKIQYNNDRSREISFYYEQNARPDLRSVYENGNLVSQSRRLKEIIINASNSRVRRYAFEYQRLETEGTLSFLSNITEYGKDNTNSLPPIKFEYTEVDSGWTDLTDFVFPECTGSNIAGCFTAPDFTDAGVRLVDVNGDGLVDVVKANETVSPGAGFAKIWLNNGTGWTHSSMWGNNYPGCDDTQSICCFVQT